MKMTMTRPCAKCPFRTDIPGYLTSERMEEIVGGLIGGATFTCHETTIESDDGEDMIDGPNAQHCAGALIFLEHNEMPNQLMRIYERLGGYDRTKLDMTSPVPQDEYELIEHHAASDAYKYVGHDNSGDAPCDVEK